jgi:hypothetical protein
MTLNRSTTGPSGPASLEFGMKRLGIFICIQTLATWAMAEDIEWFRRAMTEPHRKSLPERLGDGPVFLFALICAGACLFIVGAVVYAQFRSRYWPTAIQQAHAVWLLATQAVTETASADRPADLKNTLRWRRQALAALSAEDRLAVEPVLRTTKEAGRPQEWQLFYKTRESLGWLWMLAPMMAPVLWAGYELVWMGQTGTSLWWAYLVLFAVFSLVLGVLPLSMVWTELSARRNGTPVWQVNAIGIGLGNNMNLWPQIEEIRLLEVVRSKKPPLVLVALKRSGDTETKYFPNIDPANVKLCFSDGSPASGGDPSMSLKEVMLPENANERAATVAALLRYRHQFAKAAFAAEWQAYRAA